MDELRFQRPSAEALRRAVCADLGAAERPRRILLYSSLVSADTRALVRTLRDRGARVTVALERAAFLEYLACGGFAAVALDPQTTAALPLARVLKVFTSSASTEEALNTARQSVRRLPLIILPASPDPEYAVLVAPPHLSFLIHPGSLTLEEALLGADLNRLASLAEPLA